MRSNFRGWGGCAIALALLAVAGAAEASCGPRVIVQSYYPAPVAVPAPVAYYPAPVYAPAPALGYYAPAPVLTPATTVTTTYRYGCFFKKRQVTVQQYYPPAVVYP
jgi:hypothetical protein